MDNITTSMQNHDEEKIIINENTTLTNWRMYHSQYDSEALYEVPVSLVIVLSVFYGSISVLAVAGNTLVLWVVATSRRMQNVTNCFIANLALADIVIGLFAIPFQFQAALLQRWSLPEFMCAFCPFVQVLSVSVSVFTLTAIAVDRHRAILQPLSARPSKVCAKAIICVIWCSALILATPMAIALRVTILHEGDFSNPESIRRRPFCNNVHLSHTIMVVYRVVLFLFQYLMPLCVISFVYVRMALKLWGSKTPGNAQFSRDANLMKNKKKVIKMLFIVVALFAICWLPLQTYNVFQGFFPKINEYRYINIIFFCCDWLAMSNSCYNPFIYGIYNEKFKREFRLRFPGGKKWVQSSNNDSYDLDKIHTMRFSNSFRNSHLNWRQQQAVQFPMVTYNIHFCPQPCPDHNTKRCRFGRSKDQKQVKNVHYGITTAKTDENLEETNSIKMMKKRREEKTRCFGKRGRKRSKSHEDKLYLSESGASGIRDVTLTARLTNSDCCDRKRTSMEFSASFGDSDSSNSGTCYRGVVLRKPNNARLSMDAEYVDTEIYIFQEGERPDPKILDEISL